jgi:DNA-binding transcriptional ArsR family regulator
MKIDLFDLPNKKFYVKLQTEFLDNIMKEIKKKYGSYRKFYISSRINESSFYSWYKKKMYPLSVIRKLCKSINIPLKKIQENSTELRSRTYPSISSGISSPIFPKFPIRLSEELSRIIAHLLGDGCLTINRRGHYNLQYYNKCKKLREIFKADAKKVFGNVHIHEAINKGVPYVFLPAPVSIIILSLMPKTSSSSSRVPNFIRTASRKIKKEFIKAFMDDEATVRYKPPVRYIGLTLSNKKLLKDIRDILKEFDIQTTKIHDRIYKKRYVAYYFNIINHHNLNNFCKKIGFYHPEKRKRLDKLIKYPGRISYGRGETRKLILELLNKKPLSSNKISFILARKPVTIHYHLRKLNQMKKVHRFKCDNQTLWKVI